MRFNQETDQTELGRYYFDHPKPCGVRRVMTNIPEVSKAFKIRKPRRDREWYIRQSKPSGVSLEDWRWFLRGEELHEQVEGAMAREAKERKREK